MINAIIEAVDPTSLIGTLIQDYGITGAAFGSLLFIMMRQNKNAQIRIEKLEEQQQAQYTNHLSDQKEIIKEYVGLAEHNAKVLGDLTNCLKAMKSTLERLDRH